MSSHEKLNSLFYPKYVLCRTVMWSRCMNYFFRKEAIPYVALICQLKMSNFHLFDFRHLYLLNVWKFVLVIVLSFTFLSLSSLSLSLSLTLSLFHAPISHSLSVAPILSHSYLSLSLILLLSFLYFFSPLPFPLFNFSPSFSLLSLQNSNFLPTIDIASKPMSIP